MRKLLVVAALCAVGLVAYVQAQPGGGGGMMGGGRGQGGGGGMSGVETDWALVSFEVGVDDATLAKLRPVFKLAWDARQESMESARSGAGDRTQMREEMANIQAKLEEGYRAILTPDQAKHLASLKAERAAAFRERMQGGGGAPGTGR